MKNLLLTCTLFFSFNLWAQDVYTLDTKDFGVVQRKGITVIYWSNKSRTQLRIKEAFQKYFTFADLTFVTLEAFRSKPINEEGFYLTPIFSHDQKTVTEAVLIKGRYFGKKNIVNAGYGLASITFTQPYSEKEEQHYEENLTEAQVILFSDLLDKAYVSAQAKKPFFFGSIKKLSQFLKNLCQYDKMVGKTLIIPYEYLNVLP